MAKATVDKNVNTMFTILILMAGVLITLLGTVKYARDWDEVGLTAMMAGVATMGVAIYRFFMPKR